MNPSLDTVGHQVLQRADLRAHVVHLGEGEAARVGAPQTAVDATPTVEQRWRRR